jgi:hypothetical protein
MDLVFRREKRWYMSSYFPHRSTFSIMKGYAALFDVCEVAELAIQQDRILLTDMSCSAQKATGEKIVILPCRAVKSCTELTATG